MEMIICDNVERNVISNEWDTICESRHKIIEQEKDISLLAVTGPCMLRSIKEETPQKLLDVGCGSGYLTNEASKLVDTCLGIDLSGKSIEIAKKKYDKNNLQFIQCGISDFSLDTQFDACMSNMVFMTDPEWRESVKKIFGLLKPGGVFFITITHPCFWPKYWKYENEPWFDYQSEIFIKHDFSVSLVKSIGQTTHIHRPLEQYIQGLVDVGFRIEKIDEPYPAVETPEGYEYKYPRFLFIKCRKV